MIHIGSQMEKRKKFLEAQERLEKTLSCPSLSSGKSIHSIVENQLLRTPFSGSDGEFRNLVEKRTKEVSNFLDMLRSASKDEKTASKLHGVSKNEWKLKQQTDQLRVMYREGPEGTPFHTMLCEGFVDGPIECCLCVSWESTLYEKWWPQYAIPTFKVISSSSLQKVRVGEEISIVRVKVPWPLSEREALLHNFELEYFEEDTVIILLTTIPDLEHVDISTHGFTKDGIPMAKDTVRIDVVGGFVLQKVSPTISYFRAIANIDLKIDFMPPWLINFVARQLIGNGHKLYTKAVAAVAAGDKSYSDALRKDMYVRIRERLYYPKTDMIMNKETVAESTPQSVVTNDTLENEIEEEQEERDARTVGFQPVATGADLVNRRENLDFVSPEVEHALEVLDEAIVMLRNFQMQRGTTKFLDVIGELGASDLTKETVCSNNKNSSEKCNFSGSANGAEAGSIAMDNRFREEEHVGVSPENDGHALEGKVSSKDGSTHSDSVKASVVKRQSRVFDEVMARGLGTLHWSRDKGEMKQKKGSTRKKLRFCGLTFH